MSQKQPAQYIKTNTGQVHLYTLSGMWHYLEYPDQPQTAGCYLYEPGGSIHTLHCPEDSEGRDGFMVVYGANINFDDEGNFVNIMDSGWIEQMLLAAAKSQGFEPRYIKPGGEATYSAKQAVPVLRGAGAAVRNPREPRILLPCR